MEKYYEAKKRLFAELLPEGEMAVINADDPWGRRLKEEIPREALTYGIGSDADIRAEDVELSSSGVSFWLRQRGGDRVRICSPLLGTFNVYNALAAAATAVSIRVPLKAVEEGIRNAGSVEGRVERIDEGQDFLCLVDYAHTPDALERLLLTARELVKGRGHDSSPAPRVGGAGTSPRIITVFGCGGNRDRGKRPVMGGIAEMLSDLVIITSDNPRKEDPREIIREIESGVKGDDYFSVPDRRDAINLAIKKARTGDAVVIAGKGHEDYQEVGDRRYSFSDREVAKEAIRKRLGKGAVGASRKKSL